MKPAALRRDSEGDDSLLGLAKRIPRAHRGKATVGEQEDVIEPRIVIRSERVGPDRLSVGAEADVAAGAEELEAWIVPLFNYRITIDAPTVFEDVSDGDCDREDAIVHGAAPYVKICSPTIFLCNLVPQIHDSPGRGTEAL